MQTNQILQGDNAEVLQTFPDECIDLTVTSPPYDVFDENWNIIDGQRKYKGYSWSFPTLVKELYRVTKKGGVVVWVVGDKVIDGSEAGEPFRQALHFKSVGFRLHDTMIYAKNSYMILNHNRYDPAFEFMFVLSKGTPKTFNPIRVPTVTKGAKKSYGYVNAATEEHGAAIRSGTDRTLTTKAEKYRPNVWFYTTGLHGSATDKDAFKHPAIFPEALAEDHILSWSNEGDLVLDPFAGSGTTLKMAEKLNRKWIGIEIAPEYIKIAEQRLSPYLAQERLPVA